MAASTTGILIQNRARQSNAAIKMPPVMGPAAMLMPNTALQTPIARARSVRTVIVFTTIASATGVSIDAPTPCMARATTSTVNDGASAHASDAAPKTNRPI